MRNSKLKYKPPSIEVNFRGVNASNITAVNESCKSKNLLKKYLNPSQNKSSSLIKRFAIDLNKSKKSKPDHKKSKQNANKSDMTMGKINTTQMIRSILSNGVTISPKSPNASNFKSKNKYGNMFNMTGNLTQKYNKRNKIKLNKSGTKSRDKLDYKVYHTEKSYVGRKKSNNRDKPSHKLDYTNNIMFANRDKSPDYKAKQVKDKKLSVEMDPKAFTMHRGDLKKLTQQIALEDHLDSNNNQNQSQLIVQDVSKYSEDEHSKYDSEQNEYYIDENHSEDRLETESEALSAKKVTSNPQGPMSCEPHPKMPITPRKALELYSEVLTDYEQSEILNKTVYFIGPKADKIQASVMNDHNFGYDDEKGDYKIVLKDHIDYRYEIISLLGQGSFGQVLKCFDHKLKEK